MCLLEAFKWSDKLSGGSNEGKGNNLNINCGRNENETTEWKCSEIIKKENKEGQGTVWLFMMSHF